MNRVEVRGGLTRDPVYDTIGSYNTHLMEFTIAVNGTVYDSDARQQVVKTTYVSVQVIGLVAEELAARYTLGKGDEVYVLGELDQREIEKKDGTKERKTRVTATHIDVLRCRAYTTPTGSSSGVAPTSQSDSPPF